MGDFDELIARARAGDQEAMGRLLAAHLPMMERFLRRQMGEVVRAKDQTDDFVQSTCREVLGRLDQFREGGAAEFATWLRAQAVRKVADRHRYHRRARRDVRVEVDLPGEGRGAHVAAQITSPSGEAARGEEFQRVRAAILRLPDPLREVMILYRLEGFSHAAIAERLGLSQTTVRHHHDHATALLVEWLRTRD